MRVDIRRFACALACCAAGPVVALSVAAAAVAEPATPAVPPAPGPAPAPPAQTAQAPQASAAEPGVPASGPTVGTPHLASPEALPPGSTMDPTGQGTETPNLSYLKDLWHAVQNQEISGKEALILGIAQRGMNTPVPNQAPGPNVPIFLALRKRRCRRERRRRSPRAVHWLRLRLLRLLRPRRRPERADQAGRLSTRIRSTRAGTCLCHGVPAYSSRHCDEVSSFGATPGTIDRPALSV